MKPTLFEGISLRNSNQAKISGEHGDFLNLNFPLSREDSLRHFLWVCSTLLSEQFYNHPQSFQVTAFCYGWACEYTTPHTFLHLLLGFAFFLRLQEWADWTLVIGLLIKDPPLGCFLLDGMTQRSRETQWCLLEVHSEFSKPKTVGLPAETQKITDTPPFLPLPPKSLRYCF